MATNPWEINWNEGPAAPEVLPLPETPGERRDSERADREEGRAVQNTEFSNARQLRSDFSGLPSVSEYNAALGAYSSALNTDPTAQGDQSLITSYAKMLDPNSAVREGEFQTTAETENLINQIRSRFAKEFGQSGGGMLTDQGRMRMRGEMRNLVLNRFQPAYNRDRQYYEFLAQEYNFDPQVVVGPRAESTYAPELLDPLSAPQEAAELAAPGATETRGNEIPQEYQDEHYAYLQENWGNIDPADYTAFRIGLDQKYKLTPDIRAYRDIAPQWNDFAAQGGSPADLGAVPSPNREMGVIEGGLNRAAQTSAGAGLANYFNAASAGLPAALGGSQRELNLLREANPVTSAIGEFVGGGVGAMGTGGVLGGISTGGRVAKMLANPGAADFIHSATYGAMQDEDPIRGALYGGGSAVAGNVVGRKIGEAMPGLVPFGRGPFREADASVPTPERLQQMTNDAYSRVEATGAMATPQQTQSLADRYNAILQREGRITPKNRAIDVDTPITKARTLVEDFAGEQMSPMQAQRVRSVIAEGASAPNVTDQEARLARLLRDDFDQWAEADNVLPGIRDARRLAQRGIEGQRMQEVIDVAQANNSKFTRSGYENALHNEFRALDRSIARGRDNFSPAVTEQIQRANRGNPISNTLREVGKYAPTSPMALMTGAGTVGAGVGALTGMPLVGGAVGAGVGAVGAAARNAATNRMIREAELARLIALGGDDYMEALRNATSTAANRGGRFYGGLFGTGGSYATREPSL